MERRSDEKMMELIMEFAQSRREILAVWMNGSRANPNALRDAYQDFDIVCVVEDTAVFREDKSWISRFGEIAVMQEPDDPVLFPGGGKPEKRYAYLMQFADGNRIDLSFVEKNYAAEMVREDSQTVILADKAGILPEIPPASDESYLIRKPSRDEYLACCNEFWWTLPYVGKALCRNEILYAMELMQDVVRPELLRMAEWLAGTRTGFSVSAGKGRKYLFRYLTEQEQEMILETYSLPKADEIWDAAEVMSSLFMSMADTVGCTLGYQRNQKETEGSLEYLGRLRSGEFEK